MKPQDAVFGIVLLLLFIMKKPRLFLYAGLASIFLSIPLFARWIFFTAERLTWYGAGFILAYLLVQ